VAAATTAECFPSALALAFTTALGIAFAYVLFLMMWGMMDSMDYFFSNNYIIVEKWDITTLFNTPQTRTTLDEI
jgi:hypothetical protein